MDRVYPYAVLCSSVTTSIMACAGSVETSVVAPQGNGKAQARPTASTAVSPTIDYIIAWNSLASSAQPSDLSVLALTQHLTTAKQNKTKNTQRGQMACGLVTTCKWLHRNSRMATGVVSCRTATAVWHDSRRRKHDDNSFDFQRLYLSYVDKPIQYNMKVKQDMCSSVGMLQAAPQPTSMDPQAR